jgi:DnaJ-domain-containing protein 1
MPQEKGIKSFKEIYDQVLAEMQAGRQKAATFQRSSPTERPSYILKTTFKPDASKNSQDTVPPSLKAEADHSSAPRVLSKAQKEALECFRRHGEILAVNVGDSDIKKAFRRLAKRFHPDKASGLSSEAQKNWAREFHQIHLAYRLLLERHISHK